MGGIVSSRRRRSSLYGYTSSVTLLDLPDSLLAHIASLLPLLDQLRLAAACSTLRSASASWFLELTWKLELTEVAAARSLAAWLQRTQARLHLVLTPATELPYWSAAPRAAEVLQPLASRSMAPCLATLAMAPGQGSIQVSVDAADLVRFSRLESLLAPQPHNLAGDAWHVCSLHALTHLQLSWRQLQGSFARLRNLPALRCLELFDLRGGDGGPVLRALPALRALTRLVMHQEAWLPGGGDSSRWPWRNLGSLSQLGDLCLAGFGEGAGLAAEQLPRLAPTLRGVDLMCESAQQVLPHAAACTRLTRLVLTQTWADDGLWQAAEAGPAQLPPLPATLEQLKLEDFHLADPEAALATLAACSFLTCLSLADTGCNPSEGWEHLHSLHRLCSLDLRGCSLAAVPPLHPLALTALDLSANRIAPHGFHCLPALAPSLARLGLAGCQLAALPAELATLSRLTRLDLSGNAIQSGWHHLVSLWRLVELQPAEALQYVQTLRYLP